MTDRSNRSEVRNPVLALAGVRALLARPTEDREAMALLFRDIAADARLRAQQSWKKNKGPMAAYWKACGAYATHISRAIRPHGVKADARRAADDRRERDNG